MNDFQKENTITVSLSGDASELLTKLAQDQGITLEEAMRKAIATEEHLYRARKEGAKVLILTADKEIREILFR
jgi:hypothetical protein